VTPIDAYVGKITGLTALIERHPHISLRGDTQDAALVLRQNGHSRNIYVDRPGVELSGLVEVIDNNPLVCASEFSLPSPEGTLALIALGPLIKAGILAEQPTALFSFPADRDAANRSLIGAGWQEGIVCDTAESDFGSVLSGVFMAVINTPQDESDIDALYDEVFGRAFYVRRDETSKWSPDLVREEPFAVYSLRIAPDNPTSLLTVRVLADRTGKCGAAQIVHAMNVMCGFEESLGIPNP